MRENWPGGLEETGEKRLLAILFIDLVGSTELSLRLSGEVFHRLLSEFLVRATSAVERHGGYVARYMGDGLLAYFGYPEAQEDASVRAVRAALSLRTSLAFTAVSNTGSVSVRSGIATGDVILGDFLGTGSARERPIFDQAANLAARLQAAATPDTILVSERTYRLASRSFVFRRKSGLTLKGFDGIAHAWEVLTQTGSDHRPWAGANEETAQIGRVGELGEMNRALAESTTGGTRTIFVRGEAGIGKSRLLRTFVDGLPQSACIAGRGATSPEMANVPFALARQLLGGNSGTEPSGDIDPCEFYSTAIDRLAADVESTPVLLVEDLHWADHSSLAVLAKVVGVENGTPLLLICTSREEPPTEFTHLKGSSLITLDRLDPEQTADLLNASLEGQLTPAAMLSIAARADGVPLFALELGREWVERGTIAAKALPWTLSELFAARLGRLGITARTAQALAVLGGSAAPAILGAILGTPLDQIGDDLERLRTARIVTWNSSRPDAVAFEHALLNDAVYATLLENDRAALHRRAAQLLTASLAEQTPFDTLARHWLSAGEPLIAASTFAEAGRRNREARGFREAERAVDDGLTALAAAPPSSERDRIELDLQSSLASIVQITEGYSATRARVAAERAKTLAERQGQLTERFANLAGTWMAKSSSGEFTEAAVIARRLQAIAATAGGPEFGATAWMAQLTSHFRLGELGAAEAAFIAGRESFSDPSFSTRPGAIAQTYGNAALVALFQGNRAEARRRAAFALRTARAAHVDYDLCFASYMAAILAILLGDDARAARLGRRAMDAAGRLGFPQFGAIAQIVVGRAVAALDNPSEGAGLIEAGIAAMEGTRSRVGLPLYLTWLAEAYCFDGRTTAALTALERALTANHEERYFRPESMRLKARLLAATGDETAGRQLRKDALAIAREIDGQWFLDRLALDR